MSAKKGFASFSCCPGDGDTVMQATDDVDAALSFSANWPVGNTSSGPSQTTGIYVFCDPGWATLEGQRFAVPDCCPLRLME